MENFRAKFVPPNNDHSYYPLLYLALQTTKQGGVIEMGSGWGSTPLLHDYCLAKGRNLYSYDEKEEWGSKFYNLRTDKHLVEVVKDWDSVCYTHKDSDVSVVFIDHAPGERRKEDIMNFKDINGVIVCHDTEPAANDGYRMRETFKHFKYVVEVKTNGAEATALSNTIDITKWDGQKFGKYTCTK